MRGLEAEKRLLQHLLPKSTGNILLVLVLGIPQALFKVTTTAAIRSWMVMGFRTQSTSIGLEGQGFRQLSFSGPVLKR